MYNARSAYLIQRTRSNPSALFETEGRTGEALTDGVARLARAKSRVMLLGEKKCRTTEEMVDDLPQLSAGMLS